MPITRTPIIDDDGTGTTGTVIDNAWKTELYNQIDGAVVPQVGSWIPQDTSGAGLTFSTATGTWARNGRLVAIWWQVVYPATASGAPAKIGAIPFVVTVPAGAWQGYGPLRTWWLPVGAQEAQPFDGATGAALTNAQLSGANIILSSVYLTT